MKKDFFGLLFTVTKEIFFNQKILLKTPYIQKVRDPTYIDPLITIL